MNWKAYEHPTADGTEIGIGLYEGGHSTLDLVLPHKLKTEAGVIDMLAQLSSICDKLNPPAAGDRADFERYMSEEGKWPKAVERDSAGNYKLMQAHSAWTVWQAARKEAR